MAFQVKQTQMNILSDPPFHVGHGNAIYLRIGRPPPPGKHLGLFWWEKKTSSFLSRCRRRNMTRVKTVP
jgi:hypothetical protein